MQQEIYDTYVSLFKLAEVIYLNSAIKV